MQRCIDAFGYPPRAPRRADNETTLHLGCSRIDDIDVPRWRTVSRWFGKEGDGRNHSNHLRRRCGRWPLSERDVVADWIGGGPESPRKGLINDCDWYAVHIRIH